MNFNGNREWTAYLKNLKRSPNPQTIISEMNDKRMKRVERARASRPYIFPLKFALSAAAKINPYSGTTPKLNFDVEIHGAITNLPDYKANLIHSNSERPWVSIGTEPQQPALVSAIAGFQDSGGAVSDVFRGVFYYTVPIDLREAQKVTVEIIKDTVTGAPAVHWFAFVGSRTYGPTADEAQISKADREQITKLIAARRIPEQRFLTMPIRFADPASAVSRAEGMQTPEQTEPLLIRGVKCAGNNFRLKLGIEGEDDWMPAHAPIWAVAAHGSNEKEKYFFFETPVYLPAGSSFIAEAVNSLDDATAQGNTHLTFFGETV